VSQSVHRRCGCREDGRQLGPKCPLLASDPKHGTWGYEFRHQRRKHRKHGYTTKREAQQAATKLRASLDAGTYVEPSKRTLAEYAPEALQRRQVTGSGLKPTTFNNYDRYVRQDIVPSQLGSMLLTEIRRSHVNQWVADLSKTRGATTVATTVRRALATLQMILSMAVRDEIIAASPALRVDKPAVATNDEHVRVWELETIREFLDRAQHHRLGSLFELVVHTGLRRGEITGLHWADVDLTKRQLVVRHNRVSIDGRVQETTTKSRSGARTVPLSDAAVAALLTWQLHQSGECEAAQEAWETAGHVFTMEDGRALDPAYVTRLFTKIRADLPELTFHGLRHCAGSLWLAGGADISTVSKLLGHSLIAVTADIYTHMIAGIGQRAVDGGAALIARTTPAQSGLDA
jgi:integrase